MAAGEAQLLFELRNVGYDGPFLDQNYANTAILAGTQSGEFQDVVIWLTEEIRVLGKLDERITKSEDSNTFVWELSSFLKELTCPYTSLTVGHVSDRLQTLEAKLLLLDYLVNELMALKMLEALKPKEKSTVITLHESPTAAALKDICITLGMGKPPNNVPPKMLFEKINSHLDDMVRNEGESRLSKPLFNPKERLTGDQWAKLERIQKELDHEYDLRRKMLLTRLDVTIQSFRWSNRAKDKEGTIAERYAEKRKILDALQAGGRDTDIAALLAARETLAIIEKTSSATVRKNTKSKIQRHIIGLVPDRGGRAYEHKAPALEMPSWQTQRSTGGGGGGGRGGFGGGRGGRGGGGGFQQQHSNYPNKGYNQGNGNGGQGFYQGGRGGYNNQGGGGNLASSSGGGGYYQGGGGGGGHNQNRGGRVQGGWSQSQQDYNHSGYGSGSSRGSFGGDQQQQHYSGNSSGNSRGNYGSGGGYSDRGGYGDNRNNYDNNDYNTRGGGGRGRSNYNRGGRR